MSYKNNLHVKIFLSSLVEIFEINLKIKSLMLPIFECFPKKFLFYLLRYFIKITSIKKGVHNDRTYSCSKQEDLDNHANQLNPNNDEYWNSRGEDKPDYEDDDYYDDED